MGPIAFCGVLFHLMSAFLALSRYSLWTLFALFSTAAPFLVRLAPP